jgi:hypothetical protein
VNEKLQENNKKLQTTLNSKRKKLKDLKELIKA